MAINTPHLGTSVERAEARAEHAEARTEHAEARTEQAEARTEQAETRIDQAASQTDQAEARTEQAETRAVQSELMLRASELSYRRLFEAAQVGILILDAETGRIRDANPFLIRLLGFPLSEMADKTVAELSPFKNMEPNKAMLDRLQKNGNLRYEDLSLETGDSRRIAVEFVGNMYQDGEKEVIQCNIRDVTERQRAQHEIRDLNAKLEQRVIERTEKLEAFSHSVSHDLRGPLRHVLGFLELLRNDLGTPLPEKTLHHLTKISGAANRMNTLIDDLLAFSRTGRAEVRKTEIDLGMLVEEVLEHFRDETKDRNIAWTIHPLPAVQADRALLRLALINLISNAIKFTGHRAEARIEIGCAPHPDCKEVIYIRDNGAGFDPKYSEKLFGVFQRLHTQEQFEGTGIGLANVQSIIYRHGGQVWAEGNVDAGATFYFSIPEQDGKQL